jgi:hypothetical protein
MVPGIINLFLKHMIPTASTHVKPSLFGEIGSSSSSNDFPTTTSSSDFFYQTSPKDRTKWIDGVSNTPEVGAERRVKPTTTEGNNNKNNNENNPPSTKKVSKYVKTKNDISFKVLDSGGGSGDRGGSELFSSRRLFFGE